MSTKLNRRSYEQLIREDLEALEKLRPTAIALKIRLELDHIIEIVRVSPDSEYGTGFELKNRGVFLDPANRARLETVDHPERQQIATGAQRETG